MSGCRSCSVRALWTSSTSFLWLRWDTKTNASDWSIIIGTGLWLADTEPSFISRATTTSTMQVSTPPSLTHLQLQHLDLDTHSFRGCSSKSRRKLWGNLKPSLQPGWWNSIREKEAYHSSPKKRILQSRTDLCSRSGHCLHNFLFHPSRYFRTSWQIPRWFIYPASPEIWQHLHGGGDQPPVPGQEQELRHGPGGSQHPEGQRPRSAGLQRLQGALWTWSCQEVSSRKTFNDCNGFSGLIIWLTSYPRR